MVGLRTHDSDYGARRKNLNRHRRRKNTKKKEENFSRSFRRKITPKKLDFQTAINAHLSLRRSHKLALHLGGEVLSAQVIHMALHEQPNGAPGAYPEAPYTHANQEKAAQSQGKLLPVALVGSGVALAGGIASWLLRKKHSETRKKPGTDPEIAFKYFSPHCCEWKQTSS